MMKENILVESENKDNIEQYLSKGNMVDDACKTSKINIDTSVPLVDANIAYDDDDYVPDF